MHPALLEGLASQHAKELQTTAAIRHRADARTAPAAAVRPGEPPPSITPVNRLGL